MVKRDNSKATFTARLIEACQLAGISGHGRNKLVADTMKKNGCNVSTPGVWKWFNSQAIPDSGNIVTLSKILGVRAEWLEYGVGTPTSDGSANHMFSKDYDDVYRVDVFDIQASAGSGVMIRDEFVETIKSIEYASEEAKLLFHGRPSEHIKMIGVNGDSMAGTFEPRDQIFVDVSVDFFDGDGIYIFTIDDKLYIKRLQLQFDRLAIISDNKKYETWHMDKEKIDMIRIIAKVLVSQSRAYKFHG
ncbi:S24 family peptidase [Erwinia aphidicola]|uniref:S24 family peptidase n=1 Tax=Erwinia aphidicola TaxID=68334 RepID=UPI0030D6046B